VVLPQLAVSGRPAVLALLAELGRRRWTNLLVEGGGEVLGSFLDANLVDEVHAFLAPKLFGGLDAPGPVGGLGVARVSLAWTPAGSRVEVLDGDVYVHAWR
jgi:diaminohydroxyphosphoribosylaminopyrimidine deaminase/5-amino-6-(5-phosphoribosylamino)uracil reductase